VAQVYDGFSASAIYGLGSYGFWKEGEAIDSSRTGVSSATANWRSTPLAAALALDASTASGPSSKAPYRHRAAPDRARSRTPACLLSAQAPPIVTDTTFIFVGDPY
jgi:hypothetical protein